jgi:hypothetical protein
MPWLKEHNAIFIHIPKTGGTSVLRMFGLGPEPDQFDIFYHMTEDFEYDHASARYIKSQIPDVYEQCHKFALVRNPYDRLVSEYFWKIKDKDTRGFEVGEMYFLNFVEKLYADYERILSLSQRGKSHFVPQSSYVLEDVEIFKFEEIDKCFDMLCARYGVEKPSKRHNRTEHNHYETYYTEKAKNMVYDMYYLDFLTFGYRK